MSPDVTIVCDAASVLRSGALIVREQLLMRSSLVLSRGFSIPERAPSGGGIRWRRYILQRGRVPMIWPDDGRLLQLCQLNGERSRCSLETTASYLRCVNVQWGRRVRGALRIMRGLLTREISIAIMMQRQSVHLQSPVLKRLDLLVFVQVLEKICNRRP